ncbi:hypothetical protein JCGZ_23150 [Jatropha curcas]|uniref:Uncharacterized protein n=1 Tax=Jatropha curcas TaxID=180498 RepID=A0A067JHI2_JATCU|nr:uncharacterized protein LOC105647358 [Jatropha curcas]KDP23317.1 hypothetical protein JCGZ_23150 [Jatropha curcas]
MSAYAPESDRKISKVGGRVDEDDDNEEEDEQGGGGARVRVSADTVKNKKNNNKKNKKKKKKKQQRRGYGCAKEVVLVPFIKAKNYLKQSRTNNWSSSSSATGNRFDGSCFCLKQPSTLESPADSHTSDPDDPKFTLEMLTTLIEKNDFYSKECNPHFDATSPL